MLNNNYIRLVFILSCLAIKSHGLRPFVIELETYRQDYNAELVKTLTLKLTAFSDHKAINGSLVFAKDLSQFEAVVWVTAPKANGRLWTVFNVTTDGCAILDNSAGKMNPISRMYFEKLRGRIPNLPRRCPLKKDTDYAVLDSYLNAEKFPSYLPEVDFSAFLGFRQQNEYFIKIYATGFVAMKNGKKYRSKHLN